MELNEVIGRIFGRHRTLIVVCVLVGALVGLALHWRAQPLFSSSARVTIGDSDPTTAAQSTAISDTVAAIATGPELIRQALASISVDRNPNSVAVNNISVSSLGSSGVVQITVSDPDPAVAVALTNAIANAVVTTRQAAYAAPRQALMTSLATRTTSITNQIKAIDAQVLALAPQQASLVPGVALTANARANLLTTQRNVLMQSLTVLENEQADIESDQAARSAADVTDPATTPAQPVPTRRLADLALGALLGLILGVAIAAGLESLRPTVVGRAAIARAVNAPVLAELVGSVDRWDVSEVAEAAMHVELAASGANVRHLEIMGVTRRADLSAFAEVLGAATPHLTISALDTETVRRLSHDGARPGHLRVRDMTIRRGLVLVVPGSVKLTDLEEVKNFQSLSGWPLIGVIVTHRASRRADTPSAQPPTESEVLA